MSPTDPLRALLDAAAEGDDVATAELVRRTQNEVWRLCVALGSSGEVEDLVQETYLQAIRSAPKFRGEAPVSAWMLSIARNVCADHVRLRLRQRRLIQRIVPNVESTSSFDDSATHVLLADLAPERREAFVLTQIVGISYEDAAVVMACPVGTIRSRVARARADLLAAVRQSDAL